MVMMKVDVSPAVELVVRGIPSDFMRAPAARSRSQLLTKVISRPPSSVGVVLTVEGVSLEGYFLRGGFFFAMDVIERVDERTYEVLEFVGLAFAFLEVGAEDDCFGGGDSFLEIGAG